MNSVTQIISQIASGNAGAAEQLLPLVYADLRKLAAARLAQEKPGQTLQATALVHDAYIRLVDVENAQHWDSRGHFFAAAAEAMRRILVDQARRKMSLKRGGERMRQDIDEARFVASGVGNENEILALSEALDHLAAADHQSAELVKLRYFAGLTSEQAAGVLGISSRTADRVWVYARSFLLREIESG